MPRKRNKMTKEPQELPDRRQLVEVTLVAQHSINGTHYGPGKVRVPRATAEGLREAERNYAWTEAYLHQQGSAIIGGGSRLLGANGRPVHLGEQGLPGGFFDNPSSDMAISPVARISGESR